MIIKLNTASLLLVLQTYIVNRLSEYFLCDEFPDINGVIGITMAKRKRDKRKNNDLHNIHIKLKTYILY
jgi:hypothetical protein